MAEEINEKVLCVLKKNKTTNQIEIEYIEIENPISLIINKFTSICISNESTLQQIMNFIKTTKELDVLNGSHRYCKYLNGSFQAFDASSADTIDEIIEREKLMLFNKKSDPEHYNLEQNIYLFKRELMEKYILWSKAFSISRTYQICQEDKSILTFSHRINGWSNPVYQLTSNFSVELKTNFGYGRSSYFYTKLRYKKIEIVPLSEWIEYEYAKFSEIVRYTQSHILKNEYWLEAMEFAKVACNLSITNEDKFIQKFILDECEKMVSGLEVIFSKEHFSFKTRERVEYKIDKKGHALVEFRGEKISGALEFVSKILEYERIISIKTFLRRIETCSKRIQPILIDEAKILQSKLESLVTERSEFKPKYELVVAKNADYNKKRVDLEKQMLSNGQLDADGINTDLVGLEFYKLYPSYQEFRQEFKKVTDSYRILNEHIKNYKKILGNILLYEKRIADYFEKRD